MRSDIQMLLSAPPDFSVLFDLQLSLANMLSLNFFAMPEYEDPGIPVLVFQLPEQPSNIKHLTIMFDADDDVLLDGRQVFIRLPETFDGIVHVVPKKVFASSHVFLCTYNLGEATDFENPTNDVSGYYIASYYKESTVVSIRGEHPPVGMGAFYATAEYGLISIPLSKKHVEVEGEVSNGKIPGKIRHDSGRVKFAGAYIEDTVSSNDLTIEAVFYSQLFSALPEETARYKVTIPARQSKWYIFERVSGQFADDDGFISLLSNGKIEFSAAYTGTPTTKASGLVIHFGFKEGESVDFRVRTE